MEREEFKNHTLREDKGIDQINELAATYNADMDSRTSRIYTLIENNNIEKQKTSEKYNRLYKILDEL